ncbi:polyprenyl synthetase family protein [Desulfogranum marinum]|uniref:polyprenyl synthetase family protein n=1 Tax=Desulfogranum marinum TaxID=453220 RepID=UPI001962AC6A|nr:polyprenyl synthetase family protein [Desulfogranum marinum]MBM9514105.1 polyprenyl synthetase family protein [Desulfogranum marinum]
MMPTEQVYIENLKKHAAAANIRVESAIQADLSHVLSKCDPLLQEIVKYAVFSGGKRIRPLLAILCSRLCGRDDDDLYRLAAAFEYLHVASLIHDDIIDHAQQRRGKASLVAEYGFSSAILAGDWLLSRSMRLVGKLGGQIGLTVFCQATEGMVDGEFLQLRCVANPEATEKDYFRIIQCKTGNLISSTCEIGALYGGASDDERKALSLFGDKIGTAFQVVDDLLDYQGKARETGKAVGNDFVEGKITLPFIRAYAQADAPHRALLRQLITGDRHSPQAYQQTHKLIASHDGFASAEKTAKALIEDAEQSLQLFHQHPDQESLTVLQALGQYILQRKK